MNIELTLSFYKGDEIVSEHNYLTGIEEHEREKKAVIVIPDAGKFPPTFTMCTAKVEVKKLEGEK